MAHGKQTAYWMDVNKVLNSLYEDNGDYSHGYTISDEYGGVTFKPFFLRNGEYYMNVDKDKYDEFIHEESEGSDVERGEFP